MNYDSIKMLKDNADSIDKSIAAANLYNDKKVASDLKKSHLIRMIKIEQHLQGADFNLNNLSLDILSVLDSEWYLNRSRSNS